MTATATNIQWLYLIASGNDDGVYKIGISQHPLKRLEEIKTQYDVPDAYILETMDVSTRDEVFAVENALHVKYDDCRAAGYKGREWFKLTDKQLQDIREMYSSESNAFAQATAFYGLIEERAVLEDKALKMEAKRQMQITHNRRHGRRYDTKPKGYLKRYNELGHKIRTGLLGQRFSLKSYDHPILKIVSDMTNEVNAEVSSILKGYWLKVGAGGFIGGLIIAGASNSPNVSPVAFMTGAVGAIGGGLTTASRTQKETDLAHGELMAEARQMYPPHDKQLVAVLDLQDKQSFLVQGFKESKPQLRNEPAKLPSVAKPDSSHILRRYKNKSYFPFTASAVTAAVALVVNGMSMPLEQTFAPVQQQIIAMEVQK